MYVIGNDQLSRIQNNLAVFKISLREENHHSCCRVSELFLCLFRELAKRERFLANPQRTELGARPKVVCSTFSTVMALQWVQNKSRPTESLTSKGRKSLRVLITMTYLS